MIYIRTLVFTLVIALFAVSYTNAATFTVTNTDDSGPGSLRQAAADASANVNDEDDIVFDASLAGETIVLTTGRIILSGPVNVIGPNPGSITVSGNDSSGIFLFSLGIGTTVSNVSNINFINGLESCLGNNCISDGGAVVVGSGATVNFTDCSFSNNRADCGGTGCRAQGGAVSISPSQELNGANFSRCTFNRNVASCAGSSCTSEGGAFDNSFGSGPLSIDNSTFSENASSCGGTSCGAFGGAMTDFGNTTVNNTTYANNIAICGGDGCNQEGSSIDNGDGAVRFSNTIIQNVPGVSPPNCATNIAFDDGNNIQFPGNSCGAGVQTVDAQLQPLADNGGPTQTQAISMASPAFNGGNNATCESIDQRGVVRPQFEICDIGAYELEDDPRTVPTLGEWGLIAMASLLGIVGYIVVRRRESIV